jgi:hypothetical protein
LERALGYPVVATLGDYTSELHEAHGNGKFLDEPQQLRKQTRQLVAKLLGAEMPKTPTRTGLGLFRFART